MFSVRVVINNEHITHAYNQKALITSNVGKWLLKYAARTKLHSKHDTLYIYTIYTFWIHSYRREPTKEGGGN